MTGLQVGSGPHPCPGWVNVDIQTAAAPDVVASAFSLPFPAGTFDRVYLGHVLEHLRWEDQLPAALAEVRRVAQPGGVVGVVGPDIAKGIATEQPRWLLEQIIGEGDPADPGSHQWVATERQTVRALMLAGFAAVTATTPGALMRPDWPNTVADDWQFALLAEA
jgi:predicted SAM-dependent methyltransferase